MTSQLLLGWSGLLGVIAGLIVSAAATEELKPAKRILRMTHDIIFLLAAGLFLHPAGYLAMAVGLLILTAALATMPSRQAHQLTTLLFTVILIITWDMPLFSAIAGLFLLSHMSAAGEWLARNPEMVKKGCLSRTTLSAAAREFALTMTPPLALLPLII
ncbi:hypothetical protein KY327_02120 [Candidatus Woesearchaeota archaeon]|nr:hypothetical protein [Candidatus Woesearchaeota archaeon]